MPMSITSPGNTITIYQMVQSWLFETICILVAVQVIEIILPAKIFAAMHELLHSETWPKHEFSSFLIDTHLHGLLQRKPLCIPILHFCITSFRYVREPDLGGKKSILYQIWFLSPPGFQEDIGTDFCSILPNLGNFYIQLFALYSADFCSILPNLRDFFSEWFQIW